MTEEDKEFENFMHNDKIQARWDGDTGELCVEDLKRTKKTNRTYYPAT